MTYFAGLDVGLEETAICMIDSNGRIVRELKACSEPEALVRALRALDVRYGRVGLEACPLSSWLFEGLAAAGWAWMVSSAQSRYRSRQSVMASRNSANKSTSGGSGGGGPDIRSTT